MLEKLIAQVRENIAAKLAERKAQSDKIDEVRSACLAANRNPEDDEARSVEAAVAQRAKIDEELEQFRARLAELEDEQRSNEAAAKLAREVGAPEVSRGATRVISEPRTYARENDPKGVQFLRDVAGQFLRNDPSAGERLSRHMAEERVERGDGFKDRAVGSGAFPGLVVPQYLTDLYAPVARAGRPLADAMTHHDLPSEGMTVELSKGTVGPSTDEQGTENTGVSETDQDYDPLSIPVRTIAGQQTISRQALDRGRGIDDSTMADLFRSYGTTLDSKLLNRAGDGLSAVATSIAYTDASPTAAELYPKLLQGPAEVEAALLDQQVGDTIAVMHSRRWYWLQSQLSSTWPLFGQPGAGTQAAGANYGQSYGSGFRGVLPNGTPVIVDNNIATNLGAGTNEDEIYFLSQPEAHLWEDADAPMLIRADQAKAASLGVVLVVYGYYAHTFTRRAHARKINGTGLVTPAFV